MDIKGFKSESYHGDPFGAHARPHRRKKVKKTQCARKNNAVWSTVDLRTPVLFTVDNMRHDGINTTFFEFFK